MCCLDEHPKDWRELKRGQEKSYRSRRESWKMKELKDLEIELEKARKDKTKQLPFVWEIMNSPYIEYHYSLMKDESLDESFRRNLMSRFDKHHEAGQELLLSKLDNNLDIDFHAEIIFMLGKLNDSKDRPEKEKVLDYARKLALSADSYTRDRAIIVLGWLGTIDEVPLLNDRLLNDPNAKCRTWAATSFMQMYFRNESEQLVEKVLLYLRQSIAQEQDFFALGYMIDTIQELTKKRFGLSQKSIEAEDKDKISQAKLKVERYFHKKYGE